jgi:hypothetical protein
MRYGSVVASFFVACALVAIGRPGAAAPPLIVPDVAEPAPIRIVDSSTYVLYQAELADFIDIVCFAFVNEGPRTAVKAAFDVTLLDSSGAVLAVHAMKPAGRFAPGERSAFFHGGDPRVTPNGNCYPIYAYGRNGSTFMYRSGKGGPQMVVSAILIAPRTVDYENGDAWRASGPSRVVGEHVDLPRTGPPPLEVPNGIPPVTWRNPPETQLRIDDAFLVLLDADRRALRRRNSLFRNGYLVPKRRQSQLDFYQELVDDAATLRTLAHIAILKLVRYSGTVFVYRTWSSIGMTSGIAASDIATSPPEGPVQTNDA